MNIISWCKPVYASPLEWRNCPLIDEAFIILQTFGVILSLDFTSLHSAFWSSANTISFEQAGYETVESVGNFQDVRLVSSQPFAEDTDVTISFTDISATGKNSLYYVQDVSAKQSSTVCQLIILQSQVQPVLCITEHWNIHVDYYHVL